MVCSVEVSAVWCVVWRLMLCGVSACNSGVCMLPFSSTFLPQTRRRTK